MKAKIVENDCLLKRLQPSRDQSRILQTTQKAVPLTHAVKAPLSIFAMRYSIALSTVKFSKRVVQIEVQVLPRFGNSVVLLPKETLPCVTGIAHVNNAEFKESSFPIKSSHLVYISEPR